MAFRYNIRSKSKWPRRCYSTPRPGPQKGLETVDTARIAQATAEGEEARPATLRSIYVEAVEERTRELRGYGLDEIERLGFEAKARELYPEGVGS